MSGMEAARWAGMPIPRLPMNRLSARAVRVTLGIALTAAPVPGAHVALGRDSGDPILMPWIEGDVAGMTRIWSPDGKRMIGIVEYRQHRTGDRLEAKRVARFSDGSSDEDQVEAQVGTTLEAVRGRSIIRDQRGKSILDLTI